MTRRRGRTTELCAAGPARGRQQFRKCVRGERGDGGGNALVWVLLVPIVLLVVFFGIQAAENGYARSIAQAAAEAGVRTAVSSPGDASRAAPAAQAFLSTNAGSHLHDASVSVSTDGVSVTVTVSGTPPSVFPGGAGPLTRTASGPLELLGEGAIP